jgi:NDP-sugar pyrophosphorylase family protein
MLKTADLFDFTHSLAGDYLKGFEYPWDALAGIKELIISIGEKLGDEYKQIAPKVWAHESAKIAPSASIGAPCIIGANTEIRHCAFIRGSALIGDGCVVGNSVEIKNAIIFDGVQVPHFNYVGDSVLGWRVHLGAGAITSNLRADRAQVVICADGHRLPTGRKKVGAMLGDGVEVGCNAVLCPGTVVGAGTRIYPLALVRGYVPPRCICKQTGQTVPIRRDGES